MQQDWDPALGQAQLPAALWGQGWLEPPGRSWTQAGVVTSSLGDLAPWHGGGDSPDPAGSIAQLLQICAHQHLREDRSEGTTPVPGDGAGGTEGV